MTGSRSPRIERTEAEDGLASVVLRIPSDIREVEPVVELMAHHCFDGLSPCQRTTFRLRVALTEALANAILRGNREDPAKSVSVRAELGSDSIRIEVADEGDGFGWPTTTPVLPESLEDERGRGLFIISRLADRVEFNDQGNVIWMTLPRC